MRRLITRLSNGLHTAARSAAVLALCVMFVTVLIQVVARYGFASPPVWTEDVARYMMVWTGVLGATLSFKTRSDAVLLQSVFPDPPALLGVIAEAIQSLAILSFTLPVVYFSFVGLRGGFSKGYLVRQAGLTADTLGIQMVWIVVAVPLAMILILIHLAARWVEPATATTQTETDT
ncbi:TRAP transporter small permease [Nitratireductor luteus]|uniref:TRAP transporter small permease n=1 Tax=Nitratireductor luteus TaxID=2976980 RepID=UPI0022403609|nr:TRAP transporter small permease subunit [Nitratireductor luteus]